MTTTTMLHIGELAPRGILRRRGEQVYQKVSHHLIDGDVEFNLDGPRSPSMTFIDGIISKLVINNQLDRITFVTDNERTLEKLGTISGFRDTPIFYRSSEQAERAPVPKVELR